jgi:predicted membrane GTPase involved in stress response
MYRWKVRNIGIIHMRENHDDRTPFTPAARTKSATSTKARPRWTGWSRKERGITIVSAATTAFWKDYRFNIIDIRATWTLPQKNITSGT